MSASPSPAWIQPSLPPACPPPTVTSRLDGAVADAAPRPTHRWHRRSAPAVGAGPRSSGPSAPACSASPRPTLRHSVAPTRRLTTTRSSIPSRLRSTSAAPRARSKPTMPAVLRPFDERAVGLADQQVARIAGRVAGLRVDVALADEQVDEAVVVDVLELRVPGGRREHVPTHERALRRDPALEGDVPVRRLGRAVVERLELVVALAREEHLRVAIVRSGPDWRCPCPRSAAAAIRRPRCTRAAPRRVRSATAAPRPRGSSAGRSTSAGRVGRTGSSR